MRKMYHSQRSGCNGDCVQLARSWMEVQDVFCQLPKISSRREAFLLANEIDLGPDGYGGILKTAPVIFDGRGGFEFGGKAGDGSFGAEALVLLTDSCVDVSDDLVAFDPLSGRVASWRGALWALGETQIYGGQDPLVVRKSVLSWMRNRGMGIALVDPEHAAPRLWLIVRNKRLLLVEDAKQARLLQRRLTQMGVHLNLHIGLQDAS